MNSVFFPKLGNIGGSASRHILLLLIIGLGCYFGVKLLYQKIDAGIGNQQGPAVSALAGDAASGGSAGDADEIDRAVIISRNVFLANRVESPGSLTAALMDSVQRAATDMILVGTVVETDGAAKAVIFDVEGKKQHLVREGDVINGASIVQIGAGKVLISRQGGNEMLDIAEARRLRSAAAADHRQAVVAEVADGPLSYDESDRDDGGTPPRVDINRLEEETGRAVLKGRISKDM